MDTTGAVAQSGPDAVSVHYRTCPLCEATCGLEITMAGDTVKRIRGDRDDVFSHGFICPKGSTLKQIQEDPDRLRMPLVRRDGELVEVSWDEAWAAVAEGLARVRAAGEPNAVAVYLGNPNAHTLAGGLYVRPLLKSLGTRDVFSASTVDQMPKHVSSGMMFGNPSAIPVPDLDRTDYLLMLGANPFESNGSLCTAPDFPGRIAAIRERGGRVVVVDPRRTRTAEAADEHLGIRPGTDALWLAALANEIIGTGRADLGAVAHLVDGLDRLPETLRAFTPDTVAARTRIAPEVTRRIAWELAAAPSPAARCSPRPRTTVIKRDGHPAAAAFAPGVGGVACPTGPRFVVSFRPACWPRRSSRPAPTGSARWSPWPATRFVRSRKVSASTPRWRRSTSWCRSTSM